MHVAIVWHSYPTANRGDTLIAYELIKELSRKGHKVTLLTYSERSCASDDPILRKMVHEFVFVNRDTKKLNGTFGLILPALESAVSDPFHLGSHFMSYYFSQSMKNAIYSYLRSNELDAIVFSSGMGVMAPRSMPCSVVMPLDVVSEGCKQNSLREDSKWAKLFWWAMYLKMRIYERLIYPRFDTAVFVSEWDARIAKRNAPELRVSVLSLGADLDMFNPSEKANDVSTILFFGNLSSHTNEEAVIYFIKEVFPLVRASVPEAQLELIGASPSPKTQMIAVKTPNISVLGFVEDLPTRISEATVIVAPMLSGTGTKTKVLHAMAAGKPVVATSIAVNGIVCEDGRDILIRDSPMSFATGIISLLIDKEFSRRIGENARMTIERNHSWQAFCEGLLDIIGYDSGLTGVASEGEDSSDIKKEIG